MDLGHSEEVREIGLVRYVSPKVQGVIGRLAEFDREVLRHFLNIKILHFIITLGEIICTNLLDESSELVILWQLTSQTLRGMGSREGLELVFYVALVFFQLHLLFDFVLRSWYEGLDDCANKVFLKV